MSVRIYNKTTNPWYLPVPSSEDVLYEDFEDKDGDGRYSKVFKTREEVRVYETVEVPGTHFQKINDPEYTDVKDEVFEKIKDTPSFKKMVEAKQLSYEHLANPAEDEDE